MKLNLRDLFWLILVAAVATMWWMDRSRLAADLDMVKPSFGNVPSRQPSDSTDPFAPDPWISKTPEPAASDDPSPAPLREPFDPFK
jgi:hypothetical protein